MDEDAFNMSVPKFLKKLGVSAQREIELSVREQLQAGKLRGTRSRTQRWTGASGCLHARIRAARMPMGGRRSPGLAAAKSGKLGLIEASRGAKRDSDPPAG